MASNLNAVHAEGILGIDARKNENGGRPSLFFTLGVQDSWKDRETGEYKSRMNWIPVVYSRSVSDNLVAHLTKSTPVRIYGRMESYTKEIDGQPFTMVQVRANDIEFLPRFKKNDDGGGGNRQQAQQRPQRQQRPSRRRQPEPDYEEDDFEHWGEDE